MGTAERLAQIPNLREGSWGREGEVVVAGKEQCEVSWGEGGGMGPASGGGGSGGGAGAGLPELPELPELPVLWAA